MKVTCPNCKRRIKLKKSREITCPKCKHIFDYVQYFGREGFYLLDANIFIYAKNNHPQHGNFCSSVLSMKNIATTEDVINELPVKTIESLNRNFKVYKVKKISDEVKEIKSSTEKQPSQYDLSLLQASIEHPEILGIITYDYDFRNIASGGLVDKKSGYKTKFVVCNAEELIKKSTPKTNYRIRNDD